MALTLAICSAQPNWIPRKPKLMFQICQKLRCGLWMPLALPFMSDPPLGVLGSRPLLDEQNLSFVGTDCEMHPPICTQRAERLLFEKIRDHAAGRRVLDGHRLVNDRAAEVRGRDLSTPAVGEPMDHHDEALGPHRRDVDLLALIDAVFGAHTQHLLQLPDERTGALELLGKRAVERLGA